MAGKNQDKNRFGQYFTPEAVVGFMIDPAGISPDSRIMESSCVQIYGILRKK
jgi:type I restriction-modification system DNA methylase subunit